MTHDAPSAAYTAELFKILIRTLTTEATKRIVQAMSLFCPAGAEVPLKFLMDVTAGALASYNIQRQREASANLPELLQGLRDRLGALEANRPGDEFVWVRFGETEAAPDEAGVTLN